ncbi:MAG: glycosyltransferase family 2 protein [Rhodobacterales bacterium]|nr:glycosyltransferase family 2 protein [Rhodobacterales bacterium]MDX5412453.1 glycosyltransferase family 2 protein [Rhodobacterales bacterium]
MSDTSEPSYPGGFDAILTQIEGRRDPFSYEDDEALPPLDVDFAPLRTARVDGRAPGVDGSRSTYARKLRDLSEEFAGQPELLLLHGLLIAHLRRRSAPDHTAALFQRLWAEEAEWLLARLDARWMVSAITTFGDHGATEVQRRLGQTLSVMFGMMKLYETERLFAPADPDRAHVWRKGGLQPLALQMDPYGFGGGGLDVNMLGRLWQDAGTDPVLAPLARHLLELLIRDPRTVFRRLRLMKKQREADQKAEGIRPKRGHAAPTQHIPVPARAVKTDPAQLRWGTVSLVKASLPRIAGFAAHHLDMGADRLHIHLDAPHPEAVAFLSGHPKIAVTTCDDAWWAGQKKPRMKTHQLRQAWVATQTYQSNDLDFLAHIDVDEFILAPEGFRDSLAALPADIAAVHLPPAELLAGTDDRFKLTPRQAGQDKAVLEDIYPNFGGHLRGGFISHREGKLIARCGIPSIRVGLHALLLNGHPASNRMALPGVLLGHAHAPDWETFMQHLEFRMTQGSYRKTDEEVLGLRDILELLSEEDGESGLRTFFAEVCEGNDRLVEALDAHGMLIRAPLDLDAKVKRVFGKIPKA